MIQLFNTAIAFDGIVLPPPLDILAVELQEGLRLYWSTAKDTLDKSEIELVEPDAKTLSLEKNFFSALFIYSYYRAGIAKDRRVLYAAVNQCLRGMVTGCDNILDDEYKQTLDTNLPAQASRFRSILDIMVSDRALFTILLDYCRQNNLQLDRLVQSNNVSLHSLLQSGAQEASEEGGVNTILTPDTILSKVHHYKTGVLFQCTWAIPKILEQDISPEGLAAQKALYNIGMGCQILDDMVDILSDLREKRHNYAASIIYHTEPGHVWKELHQQAPSASVDSFLADHPQLTIKLKSKALQYLESGMNNLFSEQHQYLTQPAIHFIAERIGIRL